jgi:SAM-dependent methyltransferase
MRDALGELLARWRVRAVKPHVKGRLLDVGCGLNHLVREYGNGVGVDVYQWGDVDVLASDAACLPVRDACFDTVTIIAALNHICNRRAALCEARRALRGGGQIIITMIPPRIAGLWHRIRGPWDADQKERGIAVDEKYGMTQKEVRNLLSESGFVVRREHRFMLGINCLTLAEKPGIEAIQDPRACRVSS